LQGEVFKSPALSQIGKIFLEHVRGLIDLEGEHIALLQSRKLGKYYARDQVHPDYLSKLYKTKKFKAFEGLIQKYFGS
ncbi:MAG: hypothetical protein K0U12_01685, partial [Gammaproteobacteria bacterium]|nr:hypothetical protein [Gammaproteobacteria bacterium]